MILGPDPATVRTPRYQLCTARRAARQTPVRAISPSMRSGRRSPAPPDDGAPEAEEDPDAAADPAADPEPDPDADPESVPDAACGAATRFRPGRSGNPHGAPRRPPPRTAEVERLLARPWGY